MEALLIMSHPNLLNDKPPNGGTQLHSKPANYQPNGPQPSPLHYQFNGVANTTSRDASPAGRMFTNQQIPASQLPPSAASVVKHPTVNQLTQEYGKFTLAATNKHITPLSSPKPPFSTSTPDMTHPVNHHVASSGAQQAPAFSPIDRNQFTHSTNSQFSENRVTYPNVNGAAAALSQASHLVHQNSLPTAQAVAPLPSKPVLQSSASQPRLTQIFTGENRSNSNTNLLQSNSVNLAVKPPNSVAMPNSTIRPPNTVGMSTASANFTSMPPNVSNTAQRIPNSVAPINYVGGVEIQASNPALRTPSHVAMPPTRINQIGNVVMPATTMSQPGNVVMPATTMSQPGNVARPPTTMNQPGNVAMTPTTMNQPGNVAMTPTRINQPTTMSQPGSFTTMNQPGNIAMPPTTMSQPGNVVMPSTRMSQPGNVVMPQTTINQHGNVVMPPTSLIQPGNIAMPNSQPTSTVLPAQNRNIHLKRYPAAAPTTNQPLQSQFQQGAPNQYQPQATSTQNQFQPQVNNVPYSQQPSNQQFQQPQQVNSLNQPQNNSFPNPNQYQPSVNQPTSNQFNQYATNASSYQQQQQQPNPLQQQQTPLQQPPFLPPGTQTPQSKQPAGGITSSGFNRLWGAGENYDLLQCPNILPPEGVETPQINLGQDCLNAANCSPEIFRCTLTKIPETAALLQKSRLPLGVLIHPFKDLNHLAVIQCNSIVRCRACRTYINPFVFFVDNKRWKCNLCYRVNELPEEFQYDPVTKTYGDPSRRPEIRSSTIEYIAPAEYMLRPPQPAVYLYLLDISRNAVESGYLQTFCETLLSELDNIPGDARTQIGFLAYDSALHFYSLAEGLSQPHEMTVLDIDDMFLPCPDNLLVNLKLRKEMVKDLLTQLPTRYNNSFETSSCLGAALQAAHKMMGSTGGRVTVFQATLPSGGPGALVAREDPSNRAGSDVQHLNPANDFYKRLALECSGQQIAVDLWLVNSQYVDVATVSGISRFSGGAVYHFPLFKASRVLQNEGLVRSLRRYLTRKIGFEAVMRIRCTRGMSIHTFHGNFFVRSTDLLSLPNVSPDAGFGMQVSIEESLADVQTVCFQAALLYTSSKGERRIRVHTLCLPICNTLTDVIHSADQQCIVGLLAKMAVDRSMQSSLTDAKEAFLNVAIDVLSSYRLAQNVGSGTSGLLAPRCLRLLPLYIAALLKQTAFRVGTSTRLDDRVKAMCDMKCKPLEELVRSVYPDLYPVGALADQPCLAANITDPADPSSDDILDDGGPIPCPPHLQLTARSIDSTGAYLLDTGEHMLLLVCPAVPITFLQRCLGLSDYTALADDYYDLPALPNEDSLRLRRFIAHLNEDRPQVATLQVLRENSSLRGQFLERLVEDRVETALSYHEFLQHLKGQVK